MAGSDVRQLLLQVDASVAVAQRNLQSLARSVANDANSMDTALGRVDNAFSRVNKSAEASAQAFIEGDRAAKALIASIDPLAAAQQRYDRELEKANQLLKNGSLSTAEFAKVQAGLKAQLDQSHAAFGRVGGVAGNVRAGMQQLSFQVGDVAQGFALGVKPMTIFAQQGGQIIQTFQLMAGAGNKFLSFLGGPWGLAISAAASVLLLLSTRMGENEDKVEDLVKKMQDQAAQAKLNEQANKIWANSIDGVIEAQRKLREEIEQSIRVEQIQNQQNLDKAREGQQKLRDQLAGKEKELADLQKRRANAAAGLGSPLLSPEDQQAAQVALDRLDKKIAAVNGSIGKLKQGIADSEKVIRTAAIPVARDWADALTNASSAIGQLYDTARGRIEIAAQGNQQLADSLAKVEAALGSARKASEDAAAAGVNFGKTGRTVADLTKALVAGKIGPDQYTKSVRELAKALQGAADAAKSAKKGVGEFGKQISFADAQRIAEGAGFKVNSAYRSTARQAALYNDPNVNRPGNPVARPGTSAHEGVNGKWALDIQFAPGLTPEKIRKVYGDNGVKLSAIYKEKGHFHIEGSRSQAAAQERAAEVAQAKEVRNDNGFEEKLDQLNSQLLAAKMDLVEDTHQQAEYAKELAAAEGERVKAAIQNDVEEGKLKQAQADILKAKQDEITEQRKKNIALREQVQQIREQDQTEQQAYEFKIEALRYEEEMAKTQGAKRVLLLDIIDLVYEEKQKHLEYLKAQAELVGNTAEAARIQAELNNLSAQKSRDQGRAREGSQGPLEAYYNSLPISPDQLNEALQNVAVHGLQELEDGLIAVIDGTKKVGEAFRDMASQIISELLRISIQRLLIAPLAQGLMGLLGAGAGAAGGGGLGGFAGLASMGIQTDPGAILGFASGGSFEIGGRSGVDQNVMSINGRPIAKVSKGETAIIVPKTPSVNMPANSSRGGDTFIINSTAPNSGDPRRDRRSSMQHAAILNEQLANSRRKGIAA